jgi:hypothetical protein
MTDRITDGGQPYSSVYGYLAKTGSGKWGYDVKLDYTEVGEMTLASPEREKINAARREAGEDELPYLEANRAAWMALKLATEQGKSGVSIQDSQDGKWMLVVPDPPSSVPLVAMQIHGG